MNDEGNSARSSASASTPRQWPAYLIAAVVWPIGLELLIIVPSAALGLVVPASSSNSSALEQIAAIVTPFAALVVAWWIAATLVRGRDLPEKLWIVPVAWAVVVAIPALFGFALSDTRGLVGLFGVIGSFVLGAVGFRLGITSRRH